MKNTLYNNEIFKEMLTGYYRLYSSKVTMLNDSEIIIHIAYSSCSFALEHTLIQL